MKKFKKIDFSYVITLLNNERVNLVEKLKAEGNSTDLVKRKSEIDDAIDSLLFCKEYQLSHHSKVLELPLTRDHFGGYVLMETTETGEHIRPLEQNGKEIELAGLELVVERPMELLKFYIKT